MDGQNRFLRRLSARGVELDKPSVSTGRHYTAVRGACPALTYPILRPASDRGGDGEAKRGRESEKTGYRVTVKVVVAFKPEVRPMAVMVMIPLSGPGPMSGCGAPTKLPLASVL